MRAVLPRLVLAFVFAVPPFLGLLAPSLAAEQVFTLVVRMASSTSGILQVFPDVGGGYHADLAMGGATTASTAAREYRLPLNAGSYKSLRIDPGIAPGTYTVESVTVINPQGRIYATIPLAELTAAHHLILLERTTEKAVFECPPSSYDPQIIYAPPRPLRLLPETRTLSGLMRWFGLYLAMGFVLLWVAQLALGRVAPTISRAFQAIGRGASAHPQVAILTVALVATVIAMYPLLFASRSLVSPNNGGVVLLYDLPPFNPVSSDLDIEDSRGTDVGAMMWAFVPYSSIQRRALAEGEWPLWNRYSGPGTPLWGQGQTFLFDPLHWLTLVGPDPAPGWDLKFAGHRFLLAWGVGVAGMAASGAWLPAAIAASTAPFAGFFAFRLNHPVAFTVTYAPWVLAGWFLLAQATTHRRRAAASLLLALASALVLLSSPPKEGTMMLLVVEMTGALALLLQVGFRRRLLPLVAYAVAAGIAAALATTPHWLVFLDTLRASKTHYDNAAAYFAAGGVLEAMVLGPLVEGLPLPALHAISLVLVVAALLSPWRLIQSRAALACALGAAGAIAVAHGVIPESTVIRVPLLANVHSFHVTFMTTALVPLLVLSALGARALLEASRARIVLITAGTMAVAAWILSSIGWFAGLGRFQGWLVHGAMAAAVLIPFTVFTVRRQFPRVLPVAAATLLTLLVMAPGGQHLETGIAQLDKVLIQPRPRFHLEVSSPTIDAIHAHADSPARTLGLGAILLPGSQALYDLEGVGGPDALILRSRDDLMEAPGDLIRQGWRFIFSAASLANNAPLLDMLNVRYVLAPFNDAPALGRLERVDEPDLVRAVQRSTAWPRAYFVDRVGTYAAPAELLAQARAAGSPMATVLADDARAMEITRTVPAGSGAVVPATQYRLTTNTTTFHLRAPHAGVAVLSESYMPDDFIATLNGESVPYFRVNHAFKGVAIPGAGDWEVRFEYRPRRWNLSLAAAAVGVLMLIGLAAATLGISNERRPMVRPPVTG
jgi:hypothetical protein